MPDNLLIKTKFISEKGPYTLIRYGPQYNEIGYYISPSYLKFQETVLLDGITESTKYKKIYVLIIGKHKNS